MQKNQQGNDIGSQYQTGIYTVDEESAAEVRAYTDRIRSNYPHFYTEVLPLSCFWPAEEYHQDYLDKHPGGYCHIATAEMEQIRKLNREVRND